MKRGTPQHFKTHKLAELLGIPLPHAVGLLEMLWQYTASCAPGGDVGRATDRAIAEAVHWPTKDALRLIGALIEAHWLDHGPEPNRLLIHDWPEHCEDSVHMALARAGKFFADGSQPSLRRFAKEERERLTALYTGLRGPERTARAHGTSAQSVRTARAHGTSAHSVRTALASAKPLPLPSLCQASASAKPSTVLEVSKKEGEVSSSSASRNGRMRRLPPSLPETMKVAHRIHPEASAEFLARVIAAVEKAYGSVEAPKVELCDHLVAEAIRTQTRGNQKSAGLWLHTVPECVHTWAVEGVATPPAAPLKPMDAMKERLRKKFEAKKGVNK